MTLPSLPSIWKRIVVAAALLLLLPLHRAPATASAQDPAPPDALAPQREAAAAFQRLWPTTSNNTKESSITVDAAGGVHLAFSAYTEANNTWPAYYAYCAANCATRSNWTVITVGNIGIFGGSVRLEVNKDGNPRMLWYQQVSFDDDGVYQYAQCDGGCTSSSRWTVATLSKFTDAVGPNSTRFFALDPQGNPRFLYTDTDVVNDHEGTFYAYCDSGSGCGTQSRWNEVKISDEYLLYDFSLAFAPSGAARLAFRNTAGFEDAIGYAECSAGCGSADRWNDITLVDQLGAYGSFALDLDAQGRPRLAYYSGYFDASNPNNDLLYYGWCNSGCLQASAWTIAEVGLPKNYGKEVDLAVDAQNRLQLAYYIEDILQSVYALGYTVCTSGCTTTSPAWEDSLVETDATLDATDPIQRQPGCSISYWLEVGREPSLAVDTLGQPRIGFTARHYQGGTCAIHEDIRLVRYGQSGSSTPPVRKDRKLYLPLTVNR